MSKTFSIILLSLSVLVLQSCTSTANQGNSEVLYLDPDWLLPERDEVVRGTLDNGLAYYVHKNDRPEDYVELRLVIKAGSIQEEEAQRGFAHFAEHMAFNGTEDFEKQQIIEFVESIGMQFGAHLNAYTSFDETVYQLSIPTENPENIRTGMKILENWAHKISFDALDIDQERGVVLEEWRSRKGVGERIQNASIPVNFAGTDYPNRLPIGLADIIENGTHEDLIRFYDTWYRPDSMAVVVVGDIVPEEIETLIKQEFSAIQNPDTEVTKKPQIFTQYAAPEFIIFTDEELTSPHVNINFRVDRQHITDIGSFRQEIIDTLASSIVSERLSKLIWQQENSFTTFNVGQYPMGQQYVYSVRFTPKDGQIDAAYQAILNEIRRIHQHGFSEQEAQRQKQLLINDMVNAIKKEKTTDSRAFAQQYINHFLKGTGIASQTQYFGIVNNILQDIDYEDITESFVERTNKNDAVVMITAPDESAASIPSEQQLALLWNNTKQEQIADVEFEEIPDSPLPAPPTPGEIVATDFDETLEVHEWQLSNGATVYVKKTDFKDNQILIQAVSKGGYSMITDEEYLKSFGMMTSIGSLGLGQLDAEQFNQYMQDKRFRITTKLDSYSESISGFTDNEQLDDFLQVFHANFVAPRPDEERFNWIRELYRPDIEKRLNNPTAYFYKKIREAITSENPRFVELDLEKLEQQDFNTTFNTRKRAFENAADFNFIIVGDLNLETLEELVKTYIASLPASDILDPLKALPDYDHKGVAKVNVKKGAEPKATVIMQQWEQAEWSQKNNLAFHGLIYSLRQTLRNRLREELSGVYSVNVYGNFELWPYEEFSLSVSFTCDPERVDELIGEVQTIFANYREGGFPQEHVENYKSYAQATRERYLKDNGFWFNYLASRFNPRSPVLPINEYETLVDNISAEDLNAAAKRHLQYTDGYIATLTPEISSEEGLEAETD